MKFFFVFVSFFAITIANDVSNFASIESTLKFVHVIFRHGDRTPDSLYPKDPYTEDDFYPFRIAHLTNKGKLTAYNIGTYLRKKYNKLLGDVYTPDVLNAISSNYPRCRASLESVLAGLYPPSEELIWNKDLLWEPIPYDYLPIKENKLFLSMASCPNTDKLMEENYKNIESDPITLKYNQLLPFLIENSGLTGNIYNVSINLFSTLKSEEEAGLELPNWAKTVYPEILEEISKNGWKYYIGVDDLKTLTGGFLMSKIVNNTYSTINEDNEAKNRKIYLYSGHDLNIAATLSYLDNFFPHNPNYGAHIIIEVHKYIGIYFLKFLHQNYDYLEPQPLLIPNCGIYCPLEVFVRLYAKQLDPANLDALCAG